MAKTATEEKPATDAAAIGVTDERTGKTYNLPVTDGAIRANDLKQIRTADPDDPGLLSYDPASSIRHRVAFDYVYRRRQESFVIAAIPSSSLRKAQHFSKSRGSSSR